jgi:hypothetical protein
MTVEDADANCREVEGSGQGKLDDLLPDGWKRVHPLHNDAFVHESGAAVRYEDVGWLYWPFGVPLCWNPLPTREAAMAAALRGGK